MSNNNEVRDNIDEHPEDEKAFIIWMRKHRSQLILLGLSVPAIVVAVLGMKNRNELLNLWKKLQKELNQANLLSTKWFENIPDAELSAERERVRLLYCALGDNFENATRLQNLLWRFDREMSRRAWGNEKPHAPSIHREHGWYLPNND